MALNTTYFPGDMQNPMLAKLLILFGGSPKNGDGSSQLLQKILQAAANASSGVTPVTPSDIPVNFQDSADTLDGVFYTNNGTVEVGRFESTNGRFTLNCIGGTDAKRIGLSNDISAITILAGTSKSTAAFIDYTGQDHPSSPGYVMITTKGQSATSDGMFKILNAPEDNFLSATRLEMRWWGDTRLAPVWNDNLSVFTALKLDIVNTNSDHASLCLDCQVSSASVFAIGKHGNTIQKVASLTPAASVELDFDLAYNRTITLDQATAFTTANLGAGKELCVKVLCDGTGRNLTFPADWKFVGTKPTSIAANKTGILSLKSYSAADTGVVAAWGVEA